MKETEKFKALVEIMARLRGDDGCPWDKEQTHNSIKPCLLEEAYETLEAIDEGDPRKLKEELGDLLLQVLFHAQIAEENGEFDIYDVIQAIHEKLVRRHPHVFGDGIANSPDAVLKQWEEIKRKEKGNEHRKSALDGVPKDLPSLLRAHRIQDKAARNGFDWDHVDQVFDKVEEEMQEFKDAFLKRDVDEMESELGDLFFALVNIARFLEINPDDALKKTIVRFMQRFHYIEKKVESMGTKISKMSLQELETFWQEAKRATA